jgi:hypothetical protein
MSKVKKTIKSLYGPLYFRFEVDSINEAQALIKMYEREGCYAAATHRHGKHQIYSDHKINYLEVGSK